jgi:hypothetical protein
LYDALIIRWTGGILGEPAGHNIFIVFLEQNNFEAPSAPGITFDAAPAPAFTLLRYIISENSLYL